MTATTKTLLSRSSAKRIAIYSAKLVALRDHALEVKAYTEGTKEGRQYKVSDVSVNPKQANPGLHVSTKAYLKMLKGEYRRIQTMLVTMLKDVDVTMEALDDFDTNKASPVTTTVQTKDQDFSFKARS